MCWTTAHIGEDDRQSYSFEDTEPRPVNDSYEPKANVKNLMQTRGAKELSRLTDYAGYVDGRFIDEGSWHPKREPNHRMHQMVREKVVATIDRWNEDHCLIVYTWHFSIGKIPQACPFPYLPESSRISQIICTTSRETPLHSAMATHESRLTKLLVHHIWRGSLHLRGFYYDGLSLATSCFGYSWDFLIRRPRNKQTESVATRLSSLTF